MEGSIFIGNVVFDIHIPYSSSLKEKRMVVRSIKEKLKAKFNVSVAEVGNQELWQSAVIAVVMVSGERKHLEKMIGNIITFVENNFPDVYINTYKEIL